MKYRVTIDGNEHEVDLSPRAGVPAITVDGKPLQLEVATTPGGHVLIHEGRVFDATLTHAVAAENVGLRVSVAVGATRTDARVVTERQHLRAQATKRTGAGTRELRSPMPGRILRILCEPGQAVEPNQTLIIVEAMKMENELKAGTATQVQSVEVREGATIEAGALLVRFG